MAGKLDVLAHVPLKTPIPKQELRAKANGAGIALNRINPLIEELLDDGSLFAWTISRQGRSPQTQLARFPQPAEGGEPE